jgi:hypothetical protein
MQKMQLTLVIDFPNTELLDYKSHSDWILAHFHPRGLYCLICQELMEQSR